jgi:hypothetical protein
MQPSARRLTTHQKAVLIQVLLTFPEQQVRVCYDPAAGEPRDYAQDFLTIFKVIGWDVSEGALAATWNGRFDDMSIVLNALDALPPGAEALRDALRIYEIEVATICDPACAMKAGGFILAVGGGNS